MVFGAKGTDNSRSLGTACEPQRSSLLTSLIHLDNYSSPLQTALSAIIRPSSHIHAALRPTTHYSPAEL
jgi:hypothetical protein